MHPIHTTSTAPPRLAFAVRDLRKTFKPHSPHPVEALRGLNFDIHPGEVVALLGPNGAGKTTLIDIMLGLTTSTSGTVTCLGSTPKKAVRQSRIGAVMQTGGLLPELTVKETIAMISQAYSNPLPMDDVLEQAQLAPIASRRVGKCSGGEKQRIRFALSVLGQPDILILDEPTAAMDATARHDFWKAMHLQASAGRTIIFATHYLEEAENFADRIILLADGEIIADGSVEDVRSLTASLTVECQLPAGVDITTIPGATSAHRQGNTVTLATADSDSLARYLLSHTEARNLRISASSLEDTFIALTRKDAP